MTQTSHFLQRCAVAIRAISGHDAEACVRLVADHAATFEAAAGEPSIGRAVRRACVDVLSGRLDAAGAGKTGPSVSEPAVRVALSITQRVAAETRRGPDPVGIRARDLLDRYAAIRGRATGGGPTLARQARRG